MPNKPELLVHSATKAFELLYTASPDPAAEAWSKPVIMIGLSLADTAGVRNDRIYDITANMLSTLAPEDRALVEQEVFVPEGVVVAMNNNHPWPELLSFEDFDSLGDLDLDAYKGKIKNRLRIRTEQLTQKVIKGGDRVVLTMVFQAREADNYAAVVASGGTPDPSDYPSLQAYANGYELTLPEAVAAFGARASGWVQANAAIEEARLIAVRTITTATTVAEVDTAFETAITQISAIVDSILAG